MGMVMDDFAYPTFTTPTYYSSPPPPVYYPPESQFFSQYPPYQPYYPPQTPYYPPQNQPYVSSQPSPHQPYYPSPSPYFSPQPSPYDPPSPYYPPSNQPYYPPPKLLYHPQVPPPMEDDLSAFMQEYKLDLEAQDVTLKRLETQVEQMLDTVNQMQQSSQTGEIPAQGLQPNPAHTVTVLNTPQFLHLTETQTLRSQSLTARPSMQLQEGLRSPALTVSEEKQVAKDEAEPQLQKASTPYVPPIPFPDRLKKEKQAHELVGNLQSEPKRSDPKSFEFEEVLDSGEKVTGLMDLGAVVNLRPQYNFEKTSSKNLKATDIRIEEESLLEGLDHKTFDVESQISVGEMGADDESILDFRAHKKEKSKLRSRMVNEFFGNVAANRDMSLAAMGIG